jgi:hypothetical protein
MVILNRINIRLQRWVRKRGQLELKAAYRTKYTVNTENVILYVGIMSYHYSTVIPWQVLYFRRLRVSK